LYMSQVLWDTLRKVKDGAQSRVPIELALIKLAQTDGLQPIGQVLARLEALEARLGSARPAPAPTPAAPPPRAAAPAERSAPRSGQKKKDRSP
ncbi:hypothetical protein ACFL09_06845, partial [Planctomycetota bacterium]